MGMRTKVVFLDRDGVINEARHHPSGDARNYVTKWEEFEWIPGSKEAIIRLLENDYFVAVVTNQACIGKGIVKSRDVWGIHGGMREEIQRATQHLPADQPELLRGCLVSNLRFYVCPHTAEDRCSCRKPKPGMLYAAAHKWNVHLYSAWMVGDQQSDIAAGLLAGILKLIHIDDQTPAECLPAHKLWNHGVRITNLSYAVDYILASDGTGTTEETDNVNGQID